MLDRIRAFISYYYLRYLLATELYLLETWERHTAHAIMITLFVGLLYFNKMIISAISPSYGGNDSSPPPLHAT